LLALLGVLLFIDAGELEEAKLSTADSLVLDFVRNLFPWATASVVYFLMLGLYVFICWKYVKPIERWLFTRHN